MCIYVRFKDNRVFCAHMIANSDKVGMDPYRDHVAAWTSGPAQGEKLKQRVLKQLERKLGLESRDQAVEAFVVSRRIYDEGANAMWMKRAAEEFFKPTVVEVINVHGFVAGPNIDRVLFRDAGDNHPVFYGWQPAIPMLSDAELRSQDHGPWMFLNWRDDEWELGADEEYRES